jgi:hypothetical protein
MRIGIEQFANGKAVGCLGRCEVGVNSHLWDFLSLCGLIFKGLQSDWTSD